MPRGRRGRPGLVGTMARTAVISGTATAVSGNVARKQQAKAQAAQAPAASSVAMQAEATRVAPPQDDMIAKLTQLAEMHGAGLLTDAEFTDAKAKILSA